MTTGLDLRPSQDAGASRGEPAAPSPLPGARTASVTDAGKPAIDPDALSALQQISDSYALHRAMAERLRAQGPYDEPASERARRDSLVQALHRLVELRERRDTIIEAYGLRSATDYSSSR